MNPQTFHCEASIDADEFAAIVGGIWINRPDNAWRYEGICWHWEGYEAGRLIVAKQKGFRYGLDLSTLQPGMATAGVIVAGPPPDGIDAPILSVDSISSFVRRLAAKLRAQTDAKIIAVTGSIGKTSTCYLLHHLLGHEAEVTTNGQLNYPDGIVGEMCNLTTVDYAIIEASLQGLGEATATLRPNVAVLTNVSPVHIELVGSLRALAEKKSSLFADLAPDGIAVVCSDVAFFDRVLDIARRHAQKIFTFGEHADSDFRLLEYESSQQRVSARILGENVQYTLGLLGHHMALNSLGALAAIHAIGGDWRAAIGRCADAAVVSGRGKKEQICVAGAQITVIDDAYNASPSAMQAAFITLASIRPGEHGRRIAVLADMLELGDHAADYHRQLSEDLINSGVDKVYLAGELMGYLWCELPNTITAVKRQKAGSLLWPLVNNVRNGDVILFKGSHSTGLYKLVSDIKILSSLSYRFGASARFCIPLLGLARWLEPHTPLRVKRWIAWQLTKLSKRKPTRIK